ncbi:MAG TPA: flagellar biosynthesis protein FlhB [Tepidisphaeraceae bacterium]|jgi:flagellar biosynthetic protein FlhB|nr:flagellar biosynthesis protein FlhB [Tepidisphaeraceae bacterium]
MAEDLTDKTEAPTPRRREEAREQGQIARSADLTAAALLLGFLLLMNSFGPGLIKALKAVMVELLSSASLSNLDSKNIGPAIVRSLVAAGGAAAPLLVGGVIVAIVANLLQVGLFFSGKRLQPNFEVLNPLRGLGKLFQAESLVHLVINLLKLSLVGILAWSAVTQRMGQIIAIQQLSYMQAFALGASIVYAVGLRVAVLLLVLAIIDYTYHRFKTERELRMSKQEVKEEMRRMEGDPKIKQRRRQIAFQMASKRLARDVPTADVIITNPTHFAIALKYDAATMHAPKVVAKGQDLLAQRIREIAIAHGIPIIERKPLARALYRLVEAGKEIPEQFYSAVAEILAYVYELTGKLRRARSA